MRRLRALYFLHAIFIFFFLLLFILRHYFVVISHQAAAFFSHRHSPFVVVAGKRQSSKKKAIMKTMQKFDATFKIFYAVDWTIWNGVRDGAQCPPRRLQQINFSGHHMKCYRCRSALFVNHNEFLLKNGMIWYKKRMHFFSTLPIRLANKKKNMSSQLQLLQNFQLSHSSS